MWTYKLIDLQRNIEIIKIATCFYMEYVRTISPKVLS